MKRTLATLLSIGILTVASMTALAAPKQMPDGQIFDAEFYAATYPDVAAFFGNDEAMLYQHYLLCGKNEGRLPYAPGSVSGTSTSTVTNDMIGSQDLRVDYHTKNEIASYIKNTPVANAYVVNYAALPNEDIPYSPGALNADVLNDALRLVNTYRYIAGIPANVTLNGTYNDYSQTAALVNAVNGTMSHYPGQPIGMSDDMYQRGRKGASSSNLGMGYTSLGHAITKGWISDDDDYNISRMGHRRWMLNPTMGQIGFGCVEDITAMYALDSKNNAGSGYKRVVWPAQNMPTAYFNTYDPWTISMGERVTNATVTLTCVSTGQTWSFSGSADCDLYNNQGYFNINNGSYGQSGCIIFRPQIGTVMSDGYTYHVVASGKSRSGNFSIQYNVNFFDVK